VRISTTGICRIFRGLKSERNAEIVRKGAFFKGLTRGSGFRFNPIVLVTLIITPVDNTRAVWAGHELIASE